MVKIGNNIGLPIKHVGFALYTFPCTAHGFSLHNLLHFLQFQRIYLVFLNLLEIIMCFLNLILICLVKH